MNPETILPCPGCGHDCRVMTYSETSRYQVICESFPHEEGPTHRCGYESPWGYSRKEAIQNHNSIAEGGPRASSVCPICGKDSPHHHTQEEQAQYRQKIKSASLKQIEESYPDIVVVPRRPQADWSVAAREIEGLAESWRRQAKGYFSYDSIIVEHLIICAKELEAIIRKHQSQLSAPVFADNGDEIEARLKYDSEHACPTCGGSGHKDDASPVPSQETQAVACEHKNADFFNGKLTTTNSRSLYIAWCPDCGAARTTLAKDWLLPHRSPVESVPISELEKAEAEMRGNHIISGSPGPLYNAGWSAALAWCADRLSAVIKDAK